MLLKNYLYELNETLAQVLDDKTAVEIQALTKTITEKDKANTEKMIALKDQSLKKFDDLKQDILRTAEDIEREYATEIEKTKEEIKLEAQSAFVANSQFGEYKNQVDSAYNQLSDKIQTNVSAIEELDNGVEDFKRATNSKIIQQADSIVSHISESYATKNEMQGLEERVESKIVQTTSNITDNFNKSFSYLTDDISSVGGSVKEIVSELNVYIRRGELEPGIYGVEIGRSDSLIKARFTNDRLSFYQGSSEVAYISQNNLYITRAEVLDYLKIGNESQGFFVFDTTENGLEVRWSYG
jgi:small-conductance mechanosensitive channel